MNVSDAIKAGLFSGRQADILRSLVEDGPAFVDDLVKRLGFSKGGVHRASEMLHKMGVIRMRKVDDKKGRLKHYAKKEVDPDKITRVREDRSRRDRHRMAKQRGDERPTHSELESAVREIELAKQYFLRPMLMQKIADWMSRGGRM